jgi:DNA mismatch repair protein MSH4
MPATNISRPSTSFTSRPLTTEGSKLQSRAHSIAPSISRPRTAAGISTLNNQEIICAVIESKGVSPTVGIAFLNLDSAEAILCQISDNQSYVRTIQKLSVYGPAMILVPSYGNNASSNLHDCIQQQLPECRVQAIERRYFAEDSGTEYLKNLAFADDLEAIVASLKACYFPTCCFGAVSLFGLIEPTLIMIGHEIYQCYAFHQVYISFS